MGRHPRKAPKNNQSPLRPKKSSDSTTIRALDVTAKLFAENMQLQRENIRLQEQQQKLQQQQQYREEEIRQAYLLLTDALSTQHEQEITVLQQHQQQQSYQYQQQQQLIQQINELTMREQNLQHRLAEQDRLWENHRQESEYYQRKAAKLQVANDKKDRLISELQANSLIQCYMDRSRDLECAQSMNNES